MASSIWQACAVNVAVEERAQATLELALRYAVLYVAVQVDNSGAADVVSPPSELTDEVRHTSPQGRT